MSVYLFVSFLQSPPTQSKKNHKQMLFPYIQKVCLYLTDQTSIFNFASRLYIEILCVYTGVLSIGLFVSSGEDPLESDIMPHWRIDSDVLDTFEQFVYSSGLSAGYSESAKEKLDFLKLYADKAEPLAYAREDVTEHTPRKEEILRAFSDHPNLVEALLPEELPLKNWSEKMFVDFCIEHKLPMTVSDKLLKMFHQVRPLFLKG